MVASNFQPAVYIYILYILISSLDIIYIYIYTLISESDVYPTVSDRIPIVVFNKHSQTSNVYGVSTYMTFTINKSQMQANIS